ncbi:MAG: hypothetical protein CVT90_00290 [Candidatus Altiarchaeales archaeon HGW-Altiarchaeales-3]|nr:MAG: hypothetical protein CVT90_00290 [Candidatus Altiarchaeales archaeon HGW-Altiarchaeales-3]
MNIRKIHLVNVKSYANETIHFKEGINLIGGLNGAGKTTIIESIGYALFGKKPDYTLGEFIRRGEKDGSITVWFEIEDFVYRIARTFSNKQSREWNIYESDSNRRIDLHSEEDVKKWLSQYLHLESDDSIEKIFENVVGVEQGQFAAPFLRSDRQRKDYFEPILKLDKYRKSFEATASVSRKFNEDILKVKHEIEKNNIKIQEYDEKQGDLLEIKNKIQELDNEIKNNMIFREGIVAELLVLEELKQNIDKIQNEWDKKIINIRSSEDRKERVDPEINESETAKKIVDATKTGKEKYEFLENEIKELETKQNQKTLLVKKKTDAEKNIETKKAGILSKENSFMEETKRLNDDISKRCEELKSLNDPIKTKEEFLKKISGEKEKYEFSQSGVDTLFEWKTNLQKIFEKLDTLIPEIEKKNGEINKINDKISNYEEVKKLAAEYESVNSTYENLAREIAMLEQDVVTQKENLEKSGGGKCPFLNESCKNIDSGNLEDYFKDKIRSTENKIKELSGAIEKFKNRKIKSETARETIKIYDEKIKDVKRIEDELTGNKIDIENLYKTISFINIKELFTVDPEIIDAANFESNSRSKLNFILNSYKNNEYDKHKDKQKVLKELIEITNEFILKIKAWVKDNISKIQNELTKTKNELTRLNTKGEEIEKRISEMKNRLLEIDKETKKINLSKTNLESQNELLKNLIKEIEGFGDVETIISNKKEERNTFKPDYDKYIANFASAGKLIKLTAEKEKILKNIAELNIEKQNLEDQLKEYKGKYDKTKYGDLKDKKTEYDKAISSRETLITKLKEDCEKLGKEIEGMDKIKTAILEQENKLEKLIKAGEIHDFIRNTLNLIGPKIAKYYLEYITDQANKTYRAISGENVELIWDENYNIILKDKDKIKIFKQLSGGEQMTAAIAVRLAILKQFSKIRIGFFDEPTTHLDEERREQLAETLGRLKEMDKQWFDQLFVISHDDAFETITENVVVLRKEDGISGKV